MTEQTNLLTRRELLAAVAIGIAPMTRAARTASESESDSQAIDNFFSDFTAGWIRADPNLARATRYFHGDEADRLDRQFTPETLEWRRNRIQRARRAIADLRRFDPARLSDEQRLSMDVMRTQLEVIVDEERYLDFTGSSGIPSIFPLNPLLGVNVNLVNALTVLHPLATEQDAITYVAALGQVGARLDEGLTESRRLAAKGIMPPRFILRATIDQMRQFVAVAPAQNVLVTGLEERLVASQAIPEPQRKVLSATAEEVVAAQIYPMWQNAIRFLESLDTRSSDDAGLGRFKNGSEVYSYYLRRFTSTGLSADQIHRIGLREVARIEKDMDSLLRRLGRSKGSLSARIEQLKRDQSYPLTDEGRTQIMVDVSAYIRDAEARAASLFDRTPRASVVGQPYPRFREASAAASYTAPPRDGSRPGTLQIPLRPERMTRFGLRSLIYHETIPGHHFQIGLEMESALPSFRQLRALDRGPSAMSEGWGLYAEALAAESGWYDGDPEGLLGRLDVELLRARRLVVDTGIHAKRWTRQQAIDYGIEPSEVDRYVVFPGQACSYVIGARTILGLRDKAKSALGPRFSLREFHNVVLATGTVPLHILEQQVERYIRSAGGRA